MVKSIVMSSSAKNIVYAVIGTTLEWYELSLYGLLITFFPAIIFPFYSIKKAQLVLMTGYLCSSFFKIIGGIFLAYLADKLGRKLIFLASSSLMTVSSLFMACFPTHLESSSLAIALFFFARILSGVSSGVETTGALVFSYEHAKNKYKTVSVIAVYVAIYLGYLLADALCEVLVGHFSTPQIIRYAWRIPYIIAVIIGLVIINCRFHLTETPEFVEKNYSTRLNYKFYLTKYLPLILSCIGVYLLATCLDQFLDVCNFYFIDVFHYSLHVIYDSNLYITLFTCFLIVMAQFVIPTKSPIILLVGVTLLLILFAAPSYWLLNNQKEWSYILVNILNDIPDCLIFMLITIFICRSCHASFRTSALTLISSISTALGAAFPLIVASLMRVSHTPYIVSCIIWVMSPLMIFSIYKLSRYNQIS
jgi:MFS transporter, MHS family, proline/betaine transporter